jgi:purine-nucleoside phosphorylase
VLGLSLVTNMAAGVLDREIDHKETLEVGRRVARQFTALVKALVPQLVTGDAA